MSPVSRGRSKKKRSTKARRGRRSSTTILPADAARASLTELARLVPGGPALMADARAWWPRSHAMVLDAATVLMDCGTAAELEEAVCALIGDHWRQMGEQHSGGFAPSGWLDGLLAAAKARSAEPAVRRLLRGIAVTTPHEPAAAALKLLRSSRAGAVAEQEPAWLDTPPTIVVAPDVLLLRDAYGLRFGLLSQVTTDGGPARTYLFDIDLCHGFEQVVRCGYHRDIDVATTSWRSVVGASADRAEPEPLPSTLLPQLLTGSVFDGLFAAAPIGEGFRELFRADRVAHEIFEALERAGHPVTWPKDAPQQARDLADILTGQFRAWAAAHDVDLPPAESLDDDIVRWLLGDWVTTGLTEQLALACSPHRIAAFTAYLNDDWQPDDRGRALAILPSWARYCLERSNVTGPAAEHTLSWAQRAVLDPRAVGGDTGENLTRAVDETTTIGR